MKSSLHIHSTYSDGKNSIFEIVLEAKNLGVDQIGISDHFHISPDGKKMNSDMQLSLLDKYVDEVLSYSSSKSPYVSLGLEVDFVPETFHQVQKLIDAKPFDYIIGSVHIIDNKWIIDQKDESYDSKLSDYLIKKYWLLIKQMAETGFFNIVGHIDIYKKYGLKSSFDILPLIDEALLKISKNKMAIELNTSGWHFPCKDQYPSTDVLKKCISLNIPIIISSDAHQKEHITRDFDRAYDLLKSLGRNDMAYFIKRKLYQSSF